MKAIDIKYILFILASLSLSCKKEIHNKDFELELKSIDIFLFNEVCESYIHPAPFTLSGYGFRISLLNHSNDTLMLEFNTYLSLLKDNQDFLTEFEIFKIEEKIVLYDDYKKERIKIKPKDSFSFTLRETHLSDIKFKYFDKILDNILLNNNLRFHLNSISINDSLGYIFAITRDIPRFYFIDNVIVTKNEKIKICFENHEAPPPPR